MDSSQENNNSVFKNSFFNHVFSTTEEGKSELLNIIQYSIYGVIPIIILNKIVQRFIPDADPEKSSLEIMIEIIIQLITMFCGIVFVHRIITYFPTYSGFKYENLALTNVILAFLILVLSIQTKMGIKVNILVDRLMDLWEGTNESKNSAKKNVRVRQGYGNHAPSQSDYLDNSSVQTTIFPQAPSTVSTQNVASTGYDNMMRGSGGGGQLSAPSPPMDMGYGGPMAANSLIGSTFGSF